MKKWLVCGGILFVVCWGIVAYAISNLIQAAPQIITDMTHAAGTLAAEAKNSYDAARKEQK